MIRKYHNHKPQTNPWHHKEEPHNQHKTPGKQTKQSNQLSFPHQDETRMDIKKRTTKHRTIIKLLIFASLCVGVCRVRQNVGNKIHLVQILVYIQLNFAVVSHTKYNHLDKGLSLLYLLVIS